MPDGSPETFDFVIVGAGSAGCVLADRLTENGRTTVLLLEYGGSDRSVLVQMPCALSIPMNRPRYNWGYETEPEPHLDGRRINTPRGKVLGGSSSINGMVYVRGNPFDFDRWQEEGARGWAYRDVLPYFKRSETRAEGGDVYRGSDGPLHTCYGTLKNPLYRVFIAAARQAGYPETEDINGYQQEGFGRMDMTVHAGRRWSAANAYLQACAEAAEPRACGPARSRRASWSRAGAITGVRYRLGASEVTARRGAPWWSRPGRSIRPRSCCCPASGPAEELRALGIESCTTCRASAAISRTTSNSISRSPARSRSRSIRVMNPFAKALVGARWLLRRDGLGATNHFESCGFIRSRAGVRYPDIQYPLPAARGVVRRPARWRPSTASRPMSARCARRAAARCACARPTRATSRASCSTT